MGVQRVKNWVDATLVGGGGQGQQKFSQEWREGRDFEHEVFAYMTFLYVTCLAGRRHATSTVRKAGREMVK